MTVQSNSPACGYQEGSTRGEFVPVAPQKMRGQSLKFPLKLAPFALDEVLHSARTPNRPDGPAWITHSTGTYPLVRPT